MLFFRNNLLLETGWLRKPRAVRRRMRTAIGGVHSAMVESLECRSVPTVTALFNAGALSVISDGGDTIDLAADSSGNMTLNDIPLVTSDSLTVAAKSVSSLSVTGGPSNNVIDLSGVTLAAFSALAQVNVDGGAGNDLIIGSQFADRISGQWGNDMIDGGLGLDTISGGGGNDFVDSRFSSDPSVLIAGADAVKVGASGPDLILVGSSTTGSSSTNLVQTVNTGSQAGDGAASSGNGSDPSHIVRDPVESDPANSHEEHSMFHLHWQKESAQLLPLSVPPNGSPAASYSQAVLASLSSRDLNWQVLNRNQSKVERALETSTASTQEPNDAAGLIDISDQQNSKSVARPVSADNPESSSSPSDRALIAARVAMPMAISRSKPAQTAGDVPAIFIKERDGGFIELTANVASQSAKTRSELKRTRSLTRYDQVDAEIGRFVAFGDAELVERTLAVKRPKQVTASDMIEGDVSQTSASPPRLSWKLAVTVGLAGVILQPRITRFVKSRSLQIAAVFNSSFRSRSRNQRRVVLRATFSPRTRIHSGSSAPARNRRTPTREVSLVPPLDSCQSGL